MNGWFAIEDGGFIRQQAGLDPVEIVREVVQNAFDAEEATRIELQIEHDGSEAIVVIEDNGIGFSDSAHAYTVFLSGKADDPNKRGRRDGTADLRGRHAMACRCAATDSRSRSSYNGSARMAEESEGSDPRAHG
jgi:signal transduction histidine kinase